MIAGLAIGTYWSSARTMGSAHGGPPNSAEWRQSRALPAGTNQLKSRTSNTVAGLPFSDHSSAGATVQSAGEGKGACGSLGYGAPLGAIVMTTLIPPWNTHCARWLTLAGALFPGIFPSARDISFNRDISVDRVAGARKASNQ